MMRSQLGRYDAMRPCYIGFTGTPLMKREKSTVAKFGRLIHKYTIKDGVEDGRLFR